MIKNARLKYQSTLHCIFFSFCLFPERADVDLPSKFRRKEKKTYKGKFIKHFKNGDLSIRRAYKVHHLQAH